MILATIILIISENSTIFDNVDSVIRVLYQFSFLVEGKEIYGKSLPTEYLLKHAALSDKECNL